MERKTINGGAIMLDNRWFISYRHNKQDLLFRVVYEHAVVVTNVTPAQWMRRRTLNYHILYAEKISPALASELMHGGAGIPADYFEEEDYNG